VGDLQVVVVVVLVMVLSVWGNPQGGWDGRPGQPHANVARWEHGTAFGMSLRGGSAAASRSSIKVLRSNSGIKQENLQGSSQSVQPPAPGSIFSKLSLKAREAKDATKVQVI
jgi:hypothetical protein